MAAAEERWGRGGFWGGFWGSRCRDSLPPQRSDPPAALRYGWRLTRTLLAGLCSFPGCMALVDLHGDGDHKLVVGVPRGPGGPRLAVVRGAGSMRSLALPEAPAGLGAFGPAFGGAGGSGPGGPAVVVAAGPALFVYRNLRPFFKFALPPRAPEPLERDLWLQAEQDQIDPLTLKEMLEDLRWGRPRDFGGRRRG
uniref:Uncharacterized protein n=1 Tax=Geospiza parvula TaxID=87175 RepID=A0A8U8AXZ8_GEOPR